jgi:hypothetical protein
MESVRAPQTLVPTYNSTLHLKSHMNQQLSDTPHMNMGLSK